MNESFSDEMISAYLDGELTDEERGRVEQLLLDSADHRRMFDELESLRSSLQGLPTYGLDAQFAERVLRRAELERAPGPRRPDASPPPGNAPQENAPSDPPRPKRPRPESGSWQAALVTVVSVAAVFMFTLFYGLSTNRKNVQSVALREGGSSAQEDGRESYQEALATPSLEDRRFNARSADSAESVPSEATAGQMEKSADASLEFKRVQPQEVPIDSSSVARSVQRGRRKRSGEPSSADSQTRPLMAAEPSLGSTGPATGRSVSPADEPLGAPAIQPAVNEAWDAFQAGGRYVVRVDVEGEVYRSGSLDRVFQQNGIAIDPSLRERLVEATGNRPRAGDMLGKSVEGDERIGGDVDVLVVSASQDQITGTLNQLRQTGVLVAMTVHAEADPDGYRQGLQTFTFERPAQVVADEELEELELDLAESSSNQDPRAQPSPDSNRQAVSGGRSVKIDSGNLEPQLRKQAAPAVSSPERVEPRAPERGQTFADTERQAAGRTARSQKNLQDQSAASFSSRSADTASPERRPAAVAGTAGIAIRVPSPPADKPLSAQLRQSLRGTTVADDEDRELRRMDRAAQTLSEAPQMEPAKTQPEKEEEQKAESPPSLGKHPLAAAVGQTPGEGLVHVVFVIRALSGARERAEPATAPAAEAAPR